MRFCAFYRGLIKAVFVVSVGMGCFLIKTGDLRASIGLIEGYTLDQWADAIKRAENSVKYPYGIKSVSCKGEEECRKVCKNTVYRTLVKYRVDRCRPSEKGIECLARRYAPIGAKDDPTNLNKNWIKNVQYFLDK